MTFTIASSASSLPTAAATGQLQCGQYLSGAAVCVLWECATERSSTSNSDLSEGHLDAPVMPVAWQATVDDVASYLARAPGSDALVERARDEVARVFGGNANIALNLMTDPESGFQQLFVVIETPLGLEDGDRLLRQLEDEWWLAAMPDDGSVAVELKHV